MSHLSRDDPGNYPKQMLHSLAQLTLKILKETKSIEIGSKLIFHLDTDAAAAGAAAASAAAFVFTTIFMVVATVAAAEAAAAPAAAASVSK